MKRLESYYYWRHALIPLSSAIRVRAIDKDRSVGYRDWYVFGIRVLRHQLMPR